MTDDQITIALCYAGKDLRDLKVEAASLLAETQRVSRDIEDQQQRADRLKQKLGVLDRIPQDQPTRAQRSNQRRSQQNTWPERLEQATATTRNEASSLDDLLDPNQAKMIDEIHAGSFDGSVTLDRFDIAAAVAAGVVGSLVDLVAVQIPTGGKWHGEWQTGSQLTFKLRAGALDHDNWLSGLAKAPFDQVNDTGITGMAPRSHRVQTFGHDPLLGWALGTLDIMRGSLTGIDVSSTVHVVNVGNPIPNVLAAIGIEAAHLLSDVFTHMGLPLPGWTGLLAVPFGEFGPDNLSVGQMARWMYLRGYGTWHLGTMATSVGVVEAVVRAYYALRQLLDEDYEYRVSVERISADARVPGQEPRYRMLSLIAHGVATTGNLGKFALYSANPLSLNIAQWMMFTRRLVQQASLETADSPLVGHYRANKAVIETGWARIGLRDVPELRTQL